MTGRLRIIDESGEREVELSRQRMTIGSSTADAIKVKSEIPSPALLSVNWDARRATWILYCPLPLTIAVIVNRRSALSGEAIPLANLDVIELPGAFLQFQRLLAPPFHRGQALERIPLDSQSLAIGRADPHGTADTTRLDLDSEDTTISRLQAVVEREGDDYFVIDRSRLGSELNGVAFTRERLVFGDRLRISGYIFEFTGDALRTIPPERLGTVYARNVTVTLGGRTILDQISLNIMAGEFIGVLGGSGQGKSTLLNALCGINPPTTGEVRIGGVQLCDWARLREIGIGFVPQDDIVHRELTVIQAITFSARLRLRLQRPQIDALVTRVIRRLGLTAHAGQRISNLSGGQRKRVSIAIELLAKPSVLFLDEPSSGLDPATEEALMTLLQSLTLTKLTVVCTTHVLQKAYLFDRILFIQEGKLVFAGDTDEARKHFLIQSGIEDYESLQHSPIERIYVLLATASKTGSEWEQEYRESPFARRAVPLLPAEVEENDENASQPNLRVSAVNALLLLASRQWQILRSDIWNVAFLIAQPLLIGILIGWVADKSALRMFLCVVATMWFGCSNGAQQIVGELPIFRRERVSGQGLNTYVLSKLGFLSTISIAQAVLLFATIVLCAHAFHPDKTDNANLAKEFAARLTPISTTSESDSASEEDFDAVDAAAAPRKAPTAGPRSSTAKHVPRNPNSLWIHSLVWFAQLFELSQNIVDSGPRLLIRNDGMPFRDSSGREIILPGRAVLTVIFAVFALHFLAIATAALTGVGIGLTISSLVANPTQAVLWVPLILIPQILFGGIVVTVADMSVSVRYFSQIMPSFAAQRIMDVAALYGITTPFLTNRTKTPLFLTSRGEKETVEWEEGGGALSQSYDKLSPVNTSWQNLAIIPSRLGQHKQVGEQVGSSFRKEYRDTVESRRDVRYRKGTVYWSLLPSGLSLLVLGSWIAVCYAAIILGLARKQTGR